MYEQRCSVSAPSVPPASASTRRSIGNTTGSRSDSRLIPRSITGGAIVLLFVGGNFPLTPRAATEPVWHTSKKVRFKN